MIQNTKIHRLCLIGMMAAILCIVSPFSLPVGPVGLSAATFGVLLIAGVLSPKDSVIAVGIYFLLGLVGVPVFAGFQGGFSVMAGPSGGFLLGYLPCVLISSLLVHRLFSKRPVLWMIAFLAGTLVLYLCGAVWMWLQLKTPLVAVLLPFIPGDIVKILAATAVGMPLHTFLHKRKDA